MPTTSRLYATALALLGVTLVFSVLQLMYRGVFITTVPGAGSILHILQWLGLLVAPVGRLVIGVVLILIAFHHLKGRLPIPATSAARIGKTLAIIGLFAWLVFISWTLYIIRQGPQASIFLRFGPANFWLSFLCAGIGLVEGGRILSMRNDS